MDNNNNNINNNNNNNNINNNNNNNNNLNNKITISTSLPESTISTTSINDILFFKLFRNIIIKNNIFSELLKYKEIYLKSQFRRFSFNAKTIVAFKYREYLKTIHLSIPSYDYDPFDLNLVEYKSGRVRAPLIRCSDVIQPGMIPESVDKVIVDSDIIEPRSIPDTVSTLILNCKCNINQMYLIPESIKVLEIKFRITEAFQDFTIPYGVEKLILTWYNFPLRSGQIPDSVAHLELGASFNQIIEPGTFGKHSRLSYLDLGFDFNKPLYINTLPSSLKTIKFSSQFKQPIKPGVLNEGLTSITFRNLDYDINSLPAGAIPSSVILVHHGRMNQL